MTNRKDVIISQSNVPLNFGKQYISTVLFNSFLCSQRLELQGRQVCAQSCECVLGYNQYSQNAKDQ